MPYITDDKLKTAFAAYVNRKLGTDDLPEGMDEFIPDYNQDACNEIVSRLLVRGYSQAQIDAWDRRKMFNRKIALYWCLVNECNLEADDKWVEKFNIADQLDTIPITNGGVIVDPEGTGIGYGRLRVCEESACCGGVMRVAGERSQYRRCY